MIDNSHSYFSSIQIVTGAKVNNEKFFHEVRKMLPQGQRLRATFYELRGKNFSVDWWCQSLFVLLHLKPKQNI